MTLHSSTGGLWADVAGGTALRDYLAVYDAEYDAIEAETLPALVDHPEFGPLLRAMSKEAQAANGLRSRRMLRRAIEQGEWREYEEDLREQGRLYAQLGVSFGGWYDVLSLFQRHIVPRLVDAYGSAPARLKDVLAAMQRYVNRVMVVIGEEYLAAKEAALRAREAENLRVEEASRAKSDFLAMMSHELRTPLNAIIGFSDMLGDGGDGSLNERQARYVTNVRDSGRHLLGLINDLLDLSKIEAGRLEVSSETCPPRRFALDAVAVLQPLAAAGSVALFVEESPAPPVAADATRLKQVLYNLLSNAIKFTPPGGTVRVGFGPGSRDGELRISIRDTGRGISGSEVETLFSPYVQLENAKAAPRSGTGLGLALTRQLVELMNGRVGVESTPGLGSTFFVDLPLAAGSAPSEIAPSPVRQGSAPLALVVEDDPAAAELIDVMLSEGGYRTVVVASSEAAIACARAQAPNIITLDVFLPAIDGWDLLRILKSDARTAHIPVVMLSISSDRKMAFSLGAVEHVVKPVDRQSLLDILARHRLPSKDVGSTRVLVVDDDVHHLERMRAELEANGIGARTVASGSEAIAVARAERFDVVLLDLVMPDLSGVEVVEALRGEERTKDIPILMITAADLTVEDRARIKGDVAAILAKGALDTSALLREIRRLTSVCEPASKTLRGSRE